jgi:hypothetical protein
MDPCMWLGSIRVGQSGKRGTSERRFAQALFVLSLQQYDVQSVGVQCHIYYGSAEVIKRICTGISLQCFPWKLKQGLHFLCCVKCSQFLVVLLHSMNTSPTDCGKQAVSIYGQHTYCRLCEECNLPTIPFTVLRVITIRVAWEWNITCT